MNIANLPEKNTSAEDCCHFAPPMTAAVAATMPKSSQCPPCPPKKYRHRTNRIQREFLFNVRIATQELISSVGVSAQKTNLFKPCLPSLAKRGGVLSLRATDKTGWGLRFAPPKGGLE
jgi:hypothetical protein